MYRSVVLLILAALGSMVVPSGQVQAKPSSATWRPAHSVCNELGEILFAALGEHALPTDMISFNKPEVPATAEGGPGNSRPVPVGRSTADVWHSGWRGQPPSDALVRRWSEAPFASIASCFDTSAHGDVPLGHLFPNWSANNASPADRSRSYRWTFRVSNPVLDKTGTHALIFSEVFRRGGLGGGTGFYHLERTSSGWKKVGERVLSNF
jgi:hypothetical protein